MTVPADLDALPRPLTAFVRRRAWADPRVRAGWVFAAVLALIGVTLATQQTLDWRRLNRAVSGEVVQATVERAIYVFQRKFSPGEEMVLSYTYHGVKYSQQGTLQGWAGGMITQGDVVPLRVDPAEPGNWTARQDVPVLASALIGPMLVLPLAAITFIAAFIGRARLLRTYRNGRRAAAQITANKLTPLAPRVRAITCALPTGGRAFEVFIPATPVAKAPGELIDVILPASRGGRPVAAVWFASDLGSGLAQGEG